MQRILIVDDQPDIVGVLRERCELEGYAVSAAGTPAGVEAGLAESLPNLILLDVFWGEEHKTGLEILRRLKAQPTTRDLPVIVMTGKPDSQLTLEALNLGALDFVAKPLDLDELMEKSRRALSAGAPAPMAVPVWDSVLIGSSPVMIDLTKSLWHVARAQADTLILGDTGTGKGLVASLIHRQGPRKQRPFYTINCTVITASLFESELFGHEANAFSGAGSQRRGRLEEAPGGIVFLDEIGDLPAEQQGKLLEFLETKRFVRVGGNEPVQVDVQILAATNSDLEKKVEKGEFRRDLYHRLQGSVLQLPLLREHAEDIPALAWYFIKKFNALYGRRIEQVAPEVFPTLKAERWDGNVRELLLKVGNAVRNCPDRTLQLKDFSLQFRPNPAAPAAGNGYYLELPYREAKEKILQEFHDAYLGHHLRQHAWNRSRTARAIGIMREQLNALARRYKLSRLRDKEPGTQA